MCVSFTQNVLLIFSFFVIIFNVWCVCLHCTCFIYLLWESLGKISSLLWISVVNNASVKPFVTYQITLFNWMNIRQLLHFSWKKILKFIFYGNQFLCDISIRYRVHILEYSYHVKRHQIQSIVFSSKPQWDCVNWIISTWFSDLSCAKKHWTFVVTETKEVTGIFDN